MGSKRRGRERLKTCESCGRTVPRDKAVDFEKRSTYTTDLRGAENVVAHTCRTVYYCISCAKHRKIFERKKEIAAKLAARGQSAAGMY
jgi:ribosomal protein S26